MTKPRIIKIVDVANLLGITPRTFGARRISLEAMGFPVYDELLGGYDRKAVTLWLDRRSNIAPVAVSSADRALAEYEARRAS